MTSPVRIGLGFALLLALVALATGLRLDASLLALVPHDGALGDAARVAADARHEAVVVEIDGTGVGTDALIEATDQLGGRFEATGLFQEVRYRVGLSDAHSTGTLLRTHAVSLVPPDALARRLSPAGLDETLQLQLMRLSGPGGGLYERRFAADPFDLATLAGASIEPSSWRVRVDRGHFLDETGQHALVFLVPALDPFDDDASSVNRAIEAELAAAALPARYLGPHRVAARAAASMQADGRMAAIGGCLLLGLFLAAALRSIRPIAGSALFVGMPLLATLAAAALLSPVHAIALALCGPLVGTALDYWLHLYVDASEPGRPADGEAPWPAILLSAGSTGLVFAVLTVSSFPVVSTLGWMGVASTGVAVLTAGLLGPVLIEHFGRVAPRVPELPRRGGALVLGGAIVAGLLALAAGFDGNPRHLLPSDPVVEQLEASFQERYGSFGNSGRVLVRGDTLGGVLDAASAVTASVSETPGLSVSSPSHLLPGPAQEARRRAALPAQDELRERVRASAERVGFRPEAFDEGIDALYTPAPSIAPSSWAGTVAAASLARQVRQDGDGYRVVVDLTFRDRGLVELVRGKLAHDVPGAELFVPSALAEQGVQQVRDELLRLGGIGVVGVCGLLLLRYRRPLFLVAALLPSAVAVAFAGAAATLMATPWNPVSACAMVLVLGLGLDYGVFMVEAARAGRESMTAKAVLLGAATTFLGFAPLVLASSSGLRGVGVAVCGGLLGAVATGLTVTPRLVAGEPLLSERAGRWVVRAALAAVLVVNLDVLVLMRATLPAPGPREAPGLQVVEAGEGERRVGPSRLLRAEGIWTLYLQGAPYERGYAGGMLTTDLIERLETETRARFEEAVPSGLARMLLLRGLVVWAARLDEHIPHDLLLEIDGYAQGAVEPWPWDPPTYTRRVYFHALHDLGQAFADEPYVDACTGFIAGPGATVDGHWLLARNFDFDGAAAFDRDKVVSFVRPDEGIPFVSVSFASMVGVVSGMNREGLAVAIQAARTDGSVRVGTPMTLLVREILQRASSLDEAEALLAQRAGFVSENVLVVDGDAGEAAVFEVGPDGLARVPVDERLAVANHFVHPSWSDDQANAHQRDETTSGPRRARMAELVAEQPIDMARAVQILSDRRAVGGGELPRGHRHALNADIATHGVVFDATARTLWVSRYPNLEGGWVSYDLERALDGDLSPRLAMPPGQPEAALAVREGRRLLKQAAAEGSEATLRQATRLMPGHPMIELEWARQHARHGRHEQARQALDRALATGFEYQDEAREAAELAGALP